MSLLDKQWIIQNSDPQKSTFQKILDNRGLSQIENLSDFHDPFLFNNMPAAIDRIRHALDHQERIIVFGDYDVDGISGTALLVHILRKLNAQVSYRIPHRVEDGYGLTPKFIPEFAAKSVKLIITVDCGISCANVVTQAKQQGIDTIITDHHSIPATPPYDAVAILHPKQENSGYPYPELTGSGVAFKLAHALIKTFLPPETHQEELQHFADLASLGTVSDLGPLSGENRLIVQRGLRTLSQTKWPGLKEIMKLSKVSLEQIDTSTIGYRIGPRINAAGRIGNPYLALSLLLQENAHPKIALLSQELEELNNERKQLTEQALSEAEKLLIPQSEALPEILIAEGSNWHVGIVGLVAGRLAEHYARPAIIMQDFGDKLVASCRSPHFFNITKALRHCSELLSTFGGHAQAAGFTLPKENLDAFKEKITAFTKQELQDHPLKSILNIDCELQPSEVTFDFLDQLDQLRPFGVGNESPKFILSNIEPLFIDQVGADKRHLKFKVESQNQQVDTIGFSLGQFANEIRQHRRIDLAFNLERNRWNNRENLQFRALDIRLNKD